VRFPENFVVHVVEDDDAVRDSLTIVLQTKGASVRAYSSAMGFLAQLPVASPACLLLDLHMPEMSGLQLLAELRERNVNIPTIVLTGNGSQLRDQALRSGALLALDKPTNIAELLAAIRSTF